MVAAPEVNTSAAPTALSARSLKLQYGEVVVVPDFSFALRPGEVTALVGPNGSGKSTILRSLARLMRPAGGAIYLDGRDIANMPTREVARRLAILPQGPEAPEGVTVWDLVGHGRYPHRGLLGSPTPADVAAIQWALKVTGLEDFTHRPVDRLSGGERQRAWIALALAQETPVLLLDEPTTFLDIRHQVEVLTLVRRLNHEHGIAVGWVLHDLNQAAAYSDRVVMLRGGRVVADGASNDVMTPSTIREVFGVEVVVIPHPVTGLPTCLACPAAP
jgi:ABC-type cobalamin/Fe3+-siderophores transport system ATPase subunit